jgi:hypothetical protein
MCNDCDKPTPSLGTPIVVTPTKDAILSDEEPRDDTGHNVGKPTPSVATLYK